MTSHSAFAAAWISTAVVVVCVGGLVAWSQHDRSAIERAADACVVACRRGDVAAVSATECRCKEGE